MAVQLASLEHSVTVIERNPESLRRLGKAKVTVIHGNGLDLESLEKAKVGECDAFFAMTRGDNTNLMAAQIVKRNFKVYRVAVKVADPLRAEAYKRLGLFTINAAALLSGMCRDWLLDEEFKPVDTYNVNLGYDL